MSNEISEKEQPDGQENEKRLGSLKLREKGFEK